MASFIYNSSVDNTNDGCLGRSSLSQKDIKQTFREIPSSCGHIVSKVKIHISLSVEFGCLIVNIIVLSCDLV